MHYGFEIKWYRKGYGRGEGKFEKPKVHWMIANKKLFLDLTIEEKQNGNRPDKAFNTVEWEIIIKEFDAKTGT